MHPVTRPKAVRSGPRWNTPSRLKSRCKAWTASCCPAPHSPRPLGRRKRGPGPTLAREAANRSRRVPPTTSILRSLALRLLMLGSSSGGASGTVLVGVGVRGVDCNGLDVNRLAEGAVMLETSLGLSPTASTTPTTPTVSADAVAPAATANRAVVPTPVTLPASAKRDDPRTG